MAAGGGASGPGPAAPAAPAAPPPVDARRFRSVLARVAGPVAVVTAVDARRVPYGFTAGSVCSLSLDPPLVGVGLAVTSSCHAAFRAATGFAVSVLGAGQQDLADRFARSGVDRFAGGALPCWPGTGEPYVPDAVALLRCAIADRITVGDHLLLVGTVLEAHVGGGHPLLRYDRAYHGGAAAVE
jgi:flavin reductase ActVB